jgi:hypothetical protein
MGRAGAYRGCYLITTVSVSLVVSLSVQETTGQAGGKTGAMPAFYHAQNSPEPNCSDRLFTGINLVVKFFNVVRFRINGQSVNFDGVFNDDLLIIL